MITVYILIGTMWLAWEFVSISPEARQTLLGSDKRWWNFIWVMVAVFAWFPALVVMVADAIWTVISRRGKR